MSAAPAPWGTDPLAPLVDALLETARQEAMATRDQAEADARVTLNRARSEAAELLAQARARGDADGRAALAVRRSQAQRQAQQIILEAQRTAVDTVRRAARAGVCGLVADPQYPAVRKAVEVEARRLLGPDAVISPVEGGGLVARAGSHEVSFRLADLADDILDQLGPRAEEPWR